MQHDDSELLAMWYSLNSKIPLAEHPVVLLSFLLVPKAGTASSQADSAFEHCLQASMLFVAAVHGESNNAHVSL